jgi:hypothetical protein
LESFVGWQPQHLTSILPKLLPYHAGRFDCAQQPQTRVESVLRSSNFGNMPARYVPFEDSVGEYGKIRKIE